MNSAAKPIPTGTKWVIVKSDGGHSTTYRVSQTGRIASGQGGSRNEVVREAVLEHIKALRKLGQTRVNTREIAAALKLPNALVEQAASQLRNEGVKVAK